MGQLLNILTSNVLGTIFWRRNCRFRLLSTLYLVQSRLDISLAMALAVCIPLQVDAFQLNESLINTGRAFIAPFSLPDYSSLEPGARLQHDAIPHLDLRAAFPSSINARLSDLDTGTARQDRLGVYLHWTIPKLFRVGVMATESAEVALNERRKKRGIDGDSEVCHQIDRCVIC